jgi:hypothetical protein
LQEGRVHISGIKDQFVLKLDKLHASSNCQYSQGQDGILSLQQQQIEELCWVAFALLHKVFSK